MMSSDDCCGKKEKFEFPDCWNNDVRMSALFAPFRSKSVNPNDWSSKMKFWTNLIETWCKHHKCAVIEVSELKSSFSRRGVTPACLDEVFHHLVRSKVLLTKDDFMALDESWRSWAVKTLVTNPLKWTFNTVKNRIITSDNQKEVHYVHLPVIEQLGEELLKNIPSSCRGKLIDYEDLMRFWGLENVEDLSLVLHWMQKQGLVDVCHENENTLVKLPKISMKQVKIAETDKAIYSLEKQEKVLEDNIKKLELQKNSSLEDTKKHLAAKSKNLAKMSLRRKKEIEKIIEKRLVILENIQGLLHRIDQVKLDAEVIDCYQKGITTLKQIFKETGLNEETVTSTMKELEDVLNSTNEIEGALSKPLDSSSDQNLEDELNELLLQDAPEVPADDLPISDPTFEKPKTEDTSKLETRLQALSI